MINVQSFGDRHQGRRRKNNEDFVVWFEPIDPEEVNNSGSLYILADGVGGAAKGERASQYAAQKVLHGYYQQTDREPAERLRELMNQASYEIFTYTEQSGGFSRMATTMVAAIVHAGKLIVAHVGDSRAYLIRGGVSKQLTRDHSIVGEMIANGDMTETQAQTSKIKNRITRSIGGEAEVHADLHPPVSLQAGDKILLCSDGLTRYALLEDIATLTAEGSPREIVDRLIKFANKRGGADNVSAILIHYGANGTLDPTIQKQRPQLPQSFDDTADTIPDIPRRKQAIVPMILILVSAAFLGIVALLYKGLINIRSQQQITPSTSFTTATSGADTAPFFFASPASELPMLTETPTIAPTHTIVNQLPPIVETFTLQPNETRIPVTGITNAPAGLNVREGPGQEWPIISTIDNNQEVIILGKNSDGAWFYISSPVPGIIGWVSRLYITVVPPEEINRILPLNVFTPTLSTSIPNE